ncbi:MAG: hypothetical protein ACU843_04030 [Gammaproteobacteria bacterium]
MKTRSPSEMLFIWYLKTIAVGCTLLIIAVVIFNYLVDPYSIYNSPRWEGVNANKPVLFRHLRLTKAHSVALARPDALLIGSSRTEHGLDPEHPALRPLYNTYNLALNGATIYENLRYFQHANAVRPLKKVVLGIDFFQFNAYRPSRPDFDEARLSSDAFGDTRKVSPTTDLLSTLASIDAFIDSFKTLSQQSNRNNVILPRGQVKQPDEESITLRSGALHSAALFSELNYIVHLYFPRPYKRFDFISDDGLVNTFDYFRRILEDSHRKNIDLTILISPAHARQWELVAAAGLWDKWEMWKREVVRVNEEVARWYRREPFPLWDFSGYNTYTTETVPKRGDRKTTMKWYWESSHYRQALGDLVLDRVLGYSDPDREIADDFGVPLSGANVEEQLRLVREGHRQYGIAHADEVREIEDMVRKYKTQ